VTAWPALGEDRHERWRWLPDRKRVLDAVTLWTLALAFAGLAVPWFLRALPVDLTSAARAGFVYACAYIATAWLTNRLGRPRLLFASMVGLQVSAILFFGLLWHLVGGIQLPMFLAVFFLPVVTSGIVLGRWPAYAVALVSAAVVGLIALAESSELRWYVFQLGIPVDPFARLVPALPARPEPFPGPTSQPSYLVVTLATFSALQGSCAWLAGSLSRDMRRLQALALSVAGVNVGEDGLFRAAVKAAPTPVAVVVAEHGQVCLVSDAFIQRLLLHGTDPTGRSLFDLVKFSDPGKVRALIHGSAGEVPFSSYRVGQEARESRLRVYSFHHQGTRYASVSLEDHTELYFLHSALQAVDEPFLVIGPDDHLCYVNRAAEKLFGALYLGMDASRGLGGPEFPDRWWRAGGSGGREPTIAIGTIPYRVRAWPVPSGRNNEILTLLQLGRSSSVEEPTSIAGAGT
jgi:PAS domain-containing protein